MSRRRKKRPWYSVDPRNVLRALAHIAAWGGWLAVVLFGLGVALSSEANAKYSPVVGWVVLSVAGVVVAATVNRWVRALPGILAVAAFNSAIMLSSGHVAMQPNRPVDRWFALAMLVLFAAGALLSSTFATRNLTFVDRVALVALYPCFVISMATEKPALIVSGLCLLVCALEWPGLITIFGELMRVASQTFDVYA